MKLVYLAFQGLTLLGLHFFLASFLVSGLDELGPKHQNILFVIEGRNTGLVFSISFTSPIKPLSSNSADIGSGTLAVTSSI